MNRFEDMVVKNHEEEIAISDELVQQHILSMLQLHFRLSNCHACDAECQKSELEALQSNALARAERGRNGKYGRNKRQARNGRYVR
jgi:hypothetical protein